MPEIRRIASITMSVLLVLALSVQTVFAQPRLLVDMHTGEVLFAEDAGLPWHPASLTKLMTAFVTFQAISTGRVRLDTPVIMSARAVREPPSRSGLPVDTALTLEDALYLLIVKSANDVAIAIAETVSGSVEKFTAEMNATAQTLDLSATHYVDPNGLSDRGQMTSARDLALLALTIRARYPQYSAMFATDAVQLGQSTLASHNELLTRFSGTDGMKTGFICAAGLNIVATAQRNGRALMAIVLGGSSARERDERTAELLLKGFSGDLPGTGQGLGEIANINAEPPDMSPLICGKQAKSYAAEQEAAFPYGLKDQPSFLDEEITGQVRDVSTLGRIRDVPLPRPRPLWAPGPATALAAGLDISLPQPRPVLRAGH